MDDLFAAIKQAKALVQSAAYPYGPPIEPLSNPYGRTTDASLAFLGPSRYNCVGGVVTFPVEQVAS